MIDPTTPAKAHTEAPDYTDAALDREPVLSDRTRHRLGWVVVVVLLLALLTVLPPLVNVGRYQRRVAQSISASIGRPVHFDEIHLHLLPLPGLTIQNFVVDEDPAFGVEPALRANTVEARLRLASLWRRRVEVSRIALQAPSINLVRRADGRWNLQGVVTEAGYLQSAPTAQGRHGSTPRFPYIEATNARINIKAGDTKLPWSLLDARLALWLPEENEWRVRLSGRPLRTDTDVSDVGELQLEGSLGRGTAGVLDQPLTVSARWASTPLGEAAKLVLGRDTGVRGAASAELEVHGTPAHMRLSTDLHLHNVRRAEFVPRLPMSIDAHCRAEAQGIVRALTAVRCAVPTAESTGLFDGVFRSRSGGDTNPSPAPDVLLLEADLPNLLQLGNAHATLDLRDGRPAYFLDWLRVFSSRIPASTAATGRVALHAEWNTPTTPGSWTLAAECHCTLTQAPEKGTGASTSAHPMPTTTTNAFAGVVTGGDPVPLPEDTSVSTARPQTWLIRLSHSVLTSNTWRGSGVAPLPGSDTVTVSAGRLLTSPAAASSNPAAASSSSASIPASPAGSSSNPAAASARPDPDSARPAVEPFSVERTDPNFTVAGTIRRSGASLQYSSAALARYAASFLPSLGDDLPPSGPGAAADTQVPIDSERTWGQPQTWTLVPSAPVPARSRRQKHS